MTGAPGTGKTTLMAELTSHCEHLTIRRPVGAVLHVTPSGQEVAELGVRRAGFGGTDGLPMNVQPRALDWMASCWYDKVLGEGDRLGNISFLERCLFLGWRLRLVVLTVSERVRLARYAERGSQQDASWISGRLTKVKNVMSWAARTSENGLPVSVLGLDGENDVTATAEEIYRAWPEWGMLRE